MSPRLHTCVFQGPMYSSEAVIRDGGLRDGGSDAVIPPRGISVSGTIEPHWNQICVCRGPRGGSGKASSKMPVAEVDLGLLGEKAGRGSCHVRSCLHTEGLLVLPRAFRDGRVPMTCCLADHPDARPDLTC